MTVYKKTITQRDMDIIECFMDNDIKEQALARLDFYTPDKLIKRYLELDPLFEHLIKIALETDKL